MINFIVLAILLLAGLQNIKSRLENPGRDKQKNGDDGFKIKP
jgi:hypothetical protein